jgi:hypothetical protein
MKTKMISITILIVCLLISNNSLLASSSKIDKRETLALTNVLPEGFKDYQKKAKGDNGINDAKLTLSLVSDANDLVIKIPDPNKKEDYNRAYCATWILCTDIMKNTKDTDVKKLILEKWNSSLRKDDLTVPYQIYAIKDSNLFTDDLWKLLENTKMRHTISAISCMLLGSSNRENEKQFTEMLIKKRDSKIDGDSKGDIQRTLNWINYSLHGDKTLPGPAARPPIPDFIGKTK